MDAKKRGVLILIFFLVSGIGYSLAYRGDKLDMGTPTTTEALEKSWTEEKKPLLAGVVGKVNINQGDLSQLDALPGVGEKLAEKIIAYRQENGDFSSIEDIMKVSGIGEKKFEKMKNFITIDGVQEE